MNHAPDPVGLSLEERTALLDQVFEDIRDRHADGTMLIGGREATLLWEATVDAFVAGNWVASLLCAQATCERVLAALVSLHELPGYSCTAPKGWESWGLGKLLGHVRSQGWVETDLLDAVAVVCDRRKPFGHWRRPLALGTPYQRIAEQVGADQDDSISPEEAVVHLLAGDALFAAVTALRLYLGNYFGGPFDPCTPPPN